MGRYATLRHAAPDIDLLALGCGVELADQAGGAEAGSGSSLAAPFVAAVLAALRDRRPELGVDDAEDLLRNTAQRASGWAMLDVAAAFRAAGLGNLVDAYQRPPAITQAVTSVSLPAPSVAPAVQMCRDSKPSREQWCVVPVLTTAYRRSDRILTLGFARPPSGAATVVRVDRHATVRARRRLLRVGARRDSFDAIRVWFVRGARRSLTLTLHPIDVESLPNPRSGA